MYFLRSSPTENYIQFKTKCLKLKYNFNYFLVEMFLQESEKESRAFSS